MAAHALRSCDGMAVNIVIGCGFCGSFTRSQYKHHNDRYDNGEENYIPLSHFPFVLTGHESHYSSSKNSPILVKRQEKNPPGELSLYTAVNSSRIVGHLLSVREALIKRFFPSISLIGPVFRMHSWIALARP